ncbi:MAG: hypothetical protein J5643_03800 [Lachnospiraceae bacterium]|nr:hypothetical protein [Lachnospiraceae bacterium]
MNKKIIIAVIVLVLAGACAGAGVAVKKYMDRKDEVKQYEFSLYAAQDRMDAFAFPMMNEVEFILGKWRMTAEARTNYESDSVEPTKEDLQEALKELREEEAESWEYKEREIRKYVDELSGKKLHLQNPPKEMKKKYENFLTYAECWERLAELRLNPSEACDSYEEYEKAYMEVSSKIRALRVKN